jgi:hypothetical protein
VLRLGDRLHRYGSKRKRLLLGLHELRIITKARLLRAGLRRQVENPFY